MPIDPDLFALMACPKCHGDLQLAQGGEAIDCPTCRLRFAIEKGIPNMLIDEAQRIEGGSPAPGARK